jgi:hypothetical protein
MTPTARTLKHLRELGYLADVTEHRVPMPGAPFPVLRDLFGVIDILAIPGPTLGADGPGDGYFHGPLAIQCTGGDNIGARISKLKTARWPRANPKKDKEGGPLILPYLRGAGFRVEAWQWRLSARSRRYELRREVVTLP